MKKMLLVAALLVVGASVKAGDYTLSQLDGVAHCLVPATTGAAFGYIAEEQLAQWAKGGIGRAAPFAFYTALAGLAAGSIAGRTPRAIWDRQELGGELSVALLSALVTIVYKQSKRGEDDLLQAYDAAAAAVADATAETAPAA